MDIISQSAECGFNNIRLYGNQGNIYMLFWLLNITKIHLLECLDLVIEARLIQIPKGLLDQIFLFLNSYKWYQKSMIFNLQ